ncbi:MAG: SUMF1/EgtB/PvdO family nonheme iron enzyme [Anaerolineae bacterium]|nr:SUMF1/EgtB/PvdO family nonheme iron enzyme [Anaerolineae bacterium]
MSPVFYLLRRGIGSGISLVVMVTVLFGLLTLGMTMAAEVSSPKLLLTPTLASIVSNATIGIIQADVHVNVRSGPGTAYAVVTTIPPSTQLIVLESPPDGAWIKVQLADGTTGYVSSILVAIVITPTPIPLPINADELAQLTVQQNADWVPLIRQINGVPMALVPTGCFLMGSDDGAADEAPIHWQCFQTAFWIDQTEVTNGQFAVFGGTANRESNQIDENYPRERINWMEARDFCIQREARLPTEAEWEYAARGPDALTYPWGHDFVADNVISSSDQTAETGSKPIGASWVGALDMSGNVAEWTSSFYDLYPYQADDGREDLEDESTLRILRGGSFLNDDTLVRASARSWVHASNVSMTNGFRCAMDYTG